ncbi:hypothetical protein B0T25DRAFT_554606 [Lasiosphaeria hispida]|uniref:MYND-type domain-containing protein n=1 Tax=Lasiosphaeria hispida TaxID=260671 RepID=A0AAJ0M9G4_9PEZI|nr:hypothetical protein B0T25DRAFT_554606 [Lasiosphaeria hispida]
MAACKACKKSPPAVTLKHCAKCSVTQYCSRDCQKADWKSHKKVCGKQGRPDRDLPFPSSADGSASLSPPIGLDGPVATPFTRLENGTWLHGRPEKDVHRLLIDSYRLRVEDMHNLEGQAEEDSIYGGAKDGVAGFSRFLDKTEQRNGLLPTWWGPEKKAACVELGRGGSGEWSSLSRAVEKSDITEHYGDTRFVMQLRMFAEAVYGRGPGGSNGAQVRRMMASMEMGGNMMGIVLDTTTGTLSPVNTR